jgi:hypothetical protein
VVSDSHSHTEGKRGLEKESEERIPDRRNHIIPSPLCVSPSPRALTQSAENQREKERRKKGMNMMIKPDKYRTLSMYADQPAGLRDNFLKNTLKYDSGTENEVLRYY